MDNEKFDPKENLKKILTTNFSPKYDMTPIIDQLSYLTYKLKGIFWLFI